MSRVTLLEGLPLEHQLAVLPYHKAKFPDIFRDSKVFVPGGLNANSDVFTSHTGTPGSIHSPVDGISSQDGQPLAMHSRYFRADSFSSFGASSENGAATWATVTTKNAHRPLKDIPRASSDATDVIKRNKYGQRLDNDLEYDRDEVQRMKKLKSCNQHYIGRGCCHFNAGKIDKCPHNHHYKFTSTELKWLRAVARETPCKKSHECDDPDCIYGHHCPFPVATEGSMRGVGCMNGDLCRFPRSMHGMETVPVKKIRVSGAF